MKKQNHLCTRKLTTSRRRQLGRNKKLAAKHLGGNPAGSKPGFKPLRPVPEIIEAGSNREQSINFRRSHTFPKVRGAE